jgi:predicted nucleic acid-binding protein
LPHRPCVLDASLLLSLGKAGQLGLLYQAPEFRWHIAPIARGELLSAETRGPVEQAILVGTITPVELAADEEAAIALFGEWTEVTDPGEAESIAIALANGWLVALEDRDAQRRLDRRVGPGHWINCANILIAAVHDGQLKLRDADVVFRGLDVFSGYAKRDVTSLVQLDPSLPPSQR